MEKPELRSTHCAWIRGGRRRILCLQEEFNMSSLVSGYEDHQSGWVALDSSDAERCRTNEELQALYDERWENHFKDCDYNVSN